jgi:signal transduction histidine kinase
VAVVGDEDRLFRVLSNLAVNALNHAPAGSAVRLAAHRENGTVVVDVDDEGPGVDAELVPNLFQKFARGERGGTGLGLYFCRITLERWGGGIGYESPAGGGARFWIRLPRVARKSDHGEAAAGR